MIVRKVDYIVAPGFMALRRFNLLLIFILKNIEYEISHLTSKYLVEEILCCIYC